MIAQRLAKDPLMISHIAFHQILEYSRPYEDMIELMDDPAAA